MSARVFLLLVLVAAEAAAAAVSDDDIAVLIELDREMSGLLDAYLEAVPECPVHPDTPIRLWVIDLAWLRAEAAIQRAVALPPPVAPADSAGDCWSDYLAAADEYFNVFSQVQRVYHGVTLPGSTLCLELENSLIVADSIWHLSEMTLFETIAEEDLYE